MGWERILGLYLELGVQETGEQALENLPARSRGCRCEMRLGGSIYNETASKHSVTRVLSARLKLGKWGWTAVEADTVFAHCAHGKTETLQGNFDLGCAACPWGFVVGRQSPDTLGSGL